MNDRFEVQSIHVSSGAILDNNPIEDYKDIYKLINVQVKVYYPPVADLRTQGPSTNEIADDLGKVIADAASKMDLISPLDSEAKVKMKHPTIFPKDDELAEEKEFGLYKVL